MNKARLLLKPRFSYNKGETKRRGESMRQAGTFGRLCRVLTAICLLALTAGAAHAEGAQTEMFDRNTPIQTVLDDPAFGDYGRLLFPVDAGYFSGDTLGNLRLTWYSHIDPDKTVEIVNTLRNRVLNGEIIFYDIYTEAEKAAHPRQARHGPVLLQGYARREIRRVQCGRRIRLCRRDARQLSPRAGAFKEGL